MSVTAFTQVRIFEGREFREVPGFSATYASECGMIGSVNKLGHFWIRKQHKLHNTKKDRRGDTTYYLNVSVKDDKTDQHRTVASHYLICVAWNGPPPNDGKRYDVNHKDSVKINNCASNLEWMTRAANIAHCFDSNENCSAIRIIATNTETKEEVTYRSIKNFAERMGLHRVDVRKFVVKHSLIPKNGWTYRIEGEKQFRFKPVKYQVVQIAYKDYLKNEIVLTESIEKASELSGVGSVTIKAYVQRNEDGKQREIHLCDHFFFQKLSMDMTWPEFTEAEIERDKARFRSFSKRSSGPRK